LRRKRRGSCQLPLLAEAKASRECSEFTLGEFFTGEFVFAPISAPLGSERVQSFSIFSFQL
jgi:hypothetical protein